MNKNEPVLTVVTNAGKTLTFDYVEEFKVQSDYRYIQVEHPAHGGMFLQATGEQPTTGDWLDIHNQLIEEGCTVAIMDCIGEGENTLDFHVAHSGQFIRLTYETREDGYHIDFTDAEILSMP